MLGWGFMKRSEYRALLRAIRSQRGRVKGNMPPPNASRFATLVKLLFTVVSAIATSAQVTMFVLGERASIIGYPTQFEGGLQAGKPIYLALDIRNGGKSTARLKTLISNPEFVVDGQIPTPSGTWLRDNPKSTLRTDVLPGGTSRIVVRVHLPGPPNSGIAQPFVDEINAERVRFYIQGELTYTDGFWFFGSRTASFCYYFDPQSRDAIAFASCP
jgi:hypothetical protein